MKKLFLIPLILSSFLFAQENRIEERKQKAIEVNNQIIKIINEHTQCIQQAKANGDFQKCREAAKAKKKSFKQGLFKQKIAHESRSHKKRIKTLQDAEHCISKEGLTPKEYRECEKREREARKSN